MNAFRPLLLLAIFVSLIASVVFSVKSFTGYLVSDFVNGSSNISSFLFLVLGVLGTWVYLSKYRRK